MCHGDKSVTAVANQVNDPGIRIAKRKYIFGDFMVFYCLKGKLFCEHFQFPFPRCSDSTDLLHLLQFAELPQAFIVYIDIVPGVYAENIQENVPKKGIS